MREIRSAHGWPMRTQNKWGCIRVDTAPLFEKWCVSLFYFVGELSTSLELDNFLCCDFNLFLRSGIDASASGTLSHGKSTKAEEGNLVTSLERIGYSLECSVESLLGIILLQSCVGSNSIYEFGLVHNICIYGVMKLFFNVIHQQI